MVLSRVGGRYGVYLNGETVIASLRGRVKSRAADRVLVGDRIRLRLHPPDAATIEEVLPRRSVLRRRTPGKSRGIRAVAANLDQVAVVGAARRPEWDARLTDRFIVVAEANGLPVLVVVNKSDLAPDAAPMTGPYRDAGYDVLVTSAADGRGLDELRQRLGGHVTLFTGPTGVGKSSLLNAVQPGLRLRTAEVSHRSGAGRHTTVSAEMYPLEGGGFVVDTPGLRDIGLWGMDAVEVAGAFPEFSRLGARCRFDNCRHVEEPGCAVAKAVLDGRLAPSRLDSYRQLLAEALGATQPWRRG